MQSNKNLKGLYVISDDALTPKFELLSKLKLALLGGAKIVQLRDKISLDDEIIGLSNEIQKLCREFDATFVMNDRFQLAIEQNYDGIHIGKSDYENFTKIRKEFDGIIGVSCYGDLEIAKYFELSGADYVAFGSFYFSPTKPASSVVPIDILRKAKEQLYIPICAIGGINMGNIDEIIDSKCDMVAIVSDIWKSDNVEKISQKYTEKLNFKDKG